MLKQLLGGNPPLTSKGQAYAQQLPQLILPLVLSPQVGCVDGDACAAQAASLARSWGV
jgi:hypothetical protein